MIRSQKGVLALVIGALGFALTIPNFLPPMAESLILGLSAGTVLSSPLRDLVNSATTPPEKKELPAVKAIRNVKERRKRVEREFEITLERFDSLVARVEEVPNPEVREELSARFQRSLDDLNRHYPKWDAEGRLRTYVVLQKIAQSMDVRNADAYLDMAYDMLVSRGDEATHMSRMTLREKVEDMYLDPQSEVAHRLAGTLMLMNREDEDYTRSMVADAIHLWTDRRFDRLVDDFAAVQVMGAKRVDSILELLDKEASKAKGANNEVAQLRAQKLKATILSASPGSAH